ncbi:MAG: DUF3150 domain-containing protein [Deltaproteobacteria bacterium]|nr:MAG: DUF3150 domain-containing protein [Deltaproteobacteria bacterium]
MKSNGNGFEEMVAIQLAVRSWPGQAKLSAEDLGLKEDEVPEIFRLGNKRLYPEEWRQMFGALANKARSYLNDHSYPFVVEYVRAIPKRNLARMVERLEELKADYLARAEEFVAHYEAIQEQWREKYPDIWPRLAPHYPTKSQLRRRFDFFWSIFDIKGAEIKEGSAPEIIEAYQRAKEELQARYEEMVEEAVVYLRKKVLEVVTNLSARLKDGRIVRNDTLESVRRMEDWFRDLNIFGDHQVEEALGKLRASLNGTDYEALKDNEALKQQLAGLADQVAAAAGKLDDVSTISGNYKRLIDLS